LLSNNKLDGRASSFILSEERTHSAIMMQAGLASYSPL
jgi:hypothetical protein